MRINSVMLAITLLVLLASIQLFADPTPEPIVSAGTRPGGTSLNAP